MFLGRVVGQATEEWPDADPRPWLPEDTEAALEWADYQASLCPGCGFPRTECLDETNDGLYEAVPVHCFACAARDAENRRVGQARSDDHYGDGSFDGLYMSISDRSDLGE